MWCGGMGRRWRARGRTRQMSGTFTRWVPLSKRRSLLDDWRDETEGFSRGERAASLVCALQSRGHVLVRI